MLSNRRWLLKFLLSVLGFVALCGHASWALADQRPDVRRCIANPDAYDGRAVWMDFRKVEVLHPDGFGVVLDGRPVRVVSETKPGTGKYAAVHGVFRKPDRIEAGPKGVKVNGYYAAQRGGVYGISGAVLLAWLWWFLRRFSLGVRGGLFHPRLDAGGAGEPPVVPPVK